LPFHTPSPASGCGGGSVSFTKQDSAPSRWELVTQFASVPAVTNATSSPNATAAPSRVAAWNVCASARLPASIQRMTSEIGAPFAGAPAGVGAGLVLVTVVLGRAADGDGTACRDVSGSSRAALPQPASSTDTIPDAISSSGIRIPARLAGALGWPAQARRHSFLR